MNRLVLVHRQSEATARFTLNLPPNSSFRLGSQISLRAFWWFVLIFSLNFSLASSNVYARTPSLATPLVVCASCATQDANEVRELTRDKSIARELKGSERHLYRIHVGAGQFISVVVVEEAGINVVVTLLGSDDAKIIEMNRSNFTNPRETVSVVAELAGDFRLEVRPDDRFGAPGRYEIRIDELREATAPDRSRVRAQKLHNEGQQLQRWGNPDLNRRANEKFNEALALWRHLGDRREEAYTLRVIGETYFHLPEFEKAREHYEQALQLWRADGDRENEAQTLIMLSRVVGDGLSERQKGLEYLNNALSLNRAMGNKQGEVHALQSFGLHHLWREEYQQALEFFSQALSLARAIGDRRGEGDALGALGFTYWGVGEYQKSLDFYGQSLPFWRAFENKTQETTTLDNMGLVYYAMGEHQKALECYAQTLTIRRAMGQRSAEADTLTGIGMVYAALGENQKALEHLNQALTIYREVGNRPSGAEGRTAPIT